MDINNLDELNKWASKLSFEEINNLPEDEILEMAMERPGHPGQYGFMLQLSFFKSQEHFAETMRALMQRLQKVENLKNKMKKENSNYSFLGFIPFRLVVENKPELNFFPLNILFAKRKIDNGKVIMGSALYEPDLTSFKVVDKTVSMTYHNKYGGNSSVVISFSENKNTFHYIGEKFVNDKSVGMADGQISSLKDEHGWQMFFTHLTLLGLSEGEKCMFEDERLEK